MEGDSSNELQELELDISQLRGMLDQAKRPNVRKELRRALDHFEAEAARTKARKADTATAAEAAPDTSKPETKPAADSTATAAAPGPVKTPAAPAPTATPAAPAASADAAAAPPAKPARVDVKAAGPWTEITTFALDLGGYNKPHVTVDVRLKGVENLPKENVTCDFTESSLDLKVVGLDGQSYRFFKTNLDKDIIPAESEVKVKKNHVIVTLAKVKGEYGYDSWSDLCAKGRRKPTSEKKKDANPQDSIMDMMKDLYDDGDDSMKKIIGEAMYKAKRGEKYEPKTDDMKMDDKLPDMDSSDI